MIYNHRFILGIFLVTCALGSVIIAYNAQSRTERAIFAKDPVKPLFLIISPHNPNECKKAVDAVAALNPAELDKWSWGCKSGDHNGYIMVQADNQQAALKMVPESLRSRARVIQMDKYTPEEWGIIGGHR